MTAAVALFSAGAVAVPVRAEPPRALTTTEQIRRLTPEEAALGRKVSVQGVVTFYHPSWGLLFVQDQTGPVFVAVDRAGTPAPIRPGQLVEVHGVTQSGDFAPSIGKPSLVPLAMTGLPTPKVATLPELATGAYDSRWVEVRGVVRSAEESSGLLILVLRVDQGLLTVRVLDAPNVEPARLVDAVVRVRGACGTVANDRRQLVGVQLWTPSIDEVVVEQAAREDPFAAAATPLANLLRFVPEGASVRRVKVRGVVTLHQPGRGVFLQTEKDAVHVHTSQTLDVLPGDDIEVVGFPGMGGPGLVLEEGLVRVLGKATPVEPSRVDAAQASSGATDGLLVRIQGRLLDVVAGAGEQALVLRDGDHAFNARMPAAAAGATLPALRPGSLIEVTGVCSLLRRESGAPRSPRSFQVFLRTSRDVAVLETSSWWTERRIRVFLGSTTALVVAALAWVAYLRRKVRGKESALKESEERYTLAVQGTQDGIWDWDLRADRIYLSPRWKSMLGYAENELGDRPEAWFDLVHAEDKPRLEARLNAHRAGVTPNFEDEHRMLHRDGGYRWVLSRGFALRDAAANAYRMAGAQTDVTDRRFYDPLTGLPNRAMFVERLEKAVLRSKFSSDHQFAVLFLDLDRFKIVNDSLGHLAGDRLLAALSQRFSSSVRPGDLIARFGGDEFAILLDPIGGPEDAARIAERIQEALQPAFDLGGSEAYSSVSIGIALSSTGYERAEDLLRDADTALYRAKSQGRARFEMFDEDMRAHVTKVMRTERDLRRAIERREFVLHYQPIVDTWTLRPLAIEALVRWQHPERGLLGPAEFVPLAEETGLIGPIGDIVLQAACAQMRAWQEHFPALGPLAVCVNISARQFGDPNLPSRIAEALAATGLPPNSLVLEITESTLMDTERAAVARLHQVREQGIRVHIDDFGTGYSSLSYLHRLPVDALKIDRSFIGQMEATEEALAVVRSILNLGHNLKLSVIAEGVETRAQAERLRALGCRIAQGYFLAAPADEVATTALLEHGIEPAAVPGKAAERPEQPA
jgi:diguanylate cyclase (GGDEF)-like protein/PAS domain S-box-containing protein